VTTTKVSEPAADRTDSRRRPLVVGVVVLAMLAAAFVVGRASTRPPGPPPAQLGTALDQAVPADIRQLPLTDEFGHPTNLAAFDGKIVVLTDFMTLCQEICPFTTAELNHVDDAATKAGLAGTVQFVNITIDPERDTPARLHAYRDFANLLPNWSLLTGTPENLALLWKYFGASYFKQPASATPSLDWMTGKPLTYDIAHSDVLLYLDKAGHERFIIQGMPDGHGAPLTAGERSFLSDTGFANLTQNQDVTWTEPQALQVVSWLTKKHLHLAS
jgi:protein SCO1/2